VTGCVLCCKAVAVLLHCRQYNRFNVTLFGDLTAGILVATNQRFDIKHCLNFQYGSNFIQISKNIHKSLSRCHVNFIANVKISTLAKSVILNGKYVKQSGHLLDPNVDGRKILKGKPNKLHERNWAGLIWLEAGYNCGSY